MWKVCPRRRSLRPLSVVVQELALPVAPVCSNGSRRAVVGELRQMQAWRVVRLCKRSSSIYSKRLCLRRLLQLPLRFLGLVVQSLVVGFDPPETALFATFASRLLGFWGSRSDLESFPLWGVIRPLESFRCLREPMLAPIGTFYPCCWLTGPLVADWSCTCAR